MRIEELAIPRKRYCLETWRENYNILPEVMVRSRGSRGSSFSLGSYPRLLRRIKKAIVNLSQSEREIFTDLNIELIRRRFL